LPDTPADLPDLTDSDILNDSYLIERHHFNPATQQFPNYVFTIRNMVTGVLRKEVLQSANKNKLVPTLVLICIFKNELTLLILYGTSKKKKKLEKQYSPIN